MYNDLEDQRQLQTAIGQSLWGSSKLFEIPLGVTVAPPLDLVRVSIPDDWGAGYTITLDDDPDNVDAADRKVEIFFGSEGQQATTGKLDFPRGRLLTLPGSYIRVVAWVENADPALLPRPVYKLGAHASLYPARSGSYRIFGTLSIGDISGFPNNFKDIAIPRFARAVRIEESTSAPFNPWEIEMRVQTGSTTTGYKGIPPVGIPYERNLPANAVVVRVRNNGPVASVWIYELEMDF